MAILAVFCEVEAEYLSVTSASALSCVTWKSRHVSRSAPGSPEHIFETAVLMGYQKVKDIKEER
jgi:hypothetical protein